MKSVLPLPFDQQLLADFLQATKPAPKNPPLTAIELENRELVKSCEILINRINAFRA